LDQVTAFAKTVPSSGYGEFTENQLSMSGDDVTYAISGEELLATHSSVRSVLD